MTIDLYAANRLPPRADKLFRIFARFEFALKMAGYASMSGRLVKIHWRDFAVSQQVGPAFLAELQAAGICPLMLTDPPKAERIIDGVYSFDDQTANPSNVGELFEMVRRVRNNLFHGGKYFDDDMERSRLLVEEAIEILLLACERHDEVKARFEGQA